MPKRMTAAMRCPLKVGATESRVPSGVATKWPAAQMPLAWLGRWVRIGPITASKAFTTSSGDGSARAAGAAASRPQARPATRTAARGRDRADAGAGLGIGLVSPVRIGVCLCRETEEYVEARPRARCFVAERVA
jgi:hypothetical protein